MKRSVINQKLQEAIEFCRRLQFHLPPWAFWTPADWANMGHQADEIRQNMLGWDITDFGMNDYEHIGLLLCTLRNGPLAEQHRPLVKSYSEKILLIGPGQVTPTHFHWFKMEDIINRGGGTMVMEVWNSRPEDEQVDSSPVFLSCDGILREIPAGGKIFLEHGQSVTLPPAVYHRLTAVPEQGMVLGGEVSRVNDDQRDNRFLDPLPRFPAIEEDAPPLHLLCTEYPPAR